ncbi:M24 family metallopeptidase [Halobellus limi]|uniref:M24 family metallopeptidase n=1 Tax=Halobellus limi TaxID=699433 RepID=A0A1H5UZG6_9EURY|nr:M24 family metallopeptidase [Halobellus limi]QCC46866.1 M24 family metallopeptidase [Halobellus limi]SEF80505.1 Xaa-Pro aminopeptidase [Halobellus limi]
MTDDASTGERAPGSEDGGVSEVDGLVDRTDDHLEHRRERLSDVLDGKGLDAVWFGRPNSFAWLTGGSNVVDRDADVGVAAAGYTRADGFVVVTDNIEAERLATEEVPEAFDVTSVPWYESSLAGAVADATAGAGAADFDVPGFEPLEVSRLRRPLAETDIERYRTLGRDVADALERVARELQAADTEHEVAAGLRVSLATRGIEAPVVLVGGSERAQRYRHYTPTRSELGDYALLSVTAERGGLYASATRTVAFEGAPEWLTDRHERAMQVETTALGATLRAAESGGTAGDVFEEVVAAYDAVGEAGEWKNHHQGGAAGFAGREWIATPGSDEAVEVPLAYAYNPTVRGAKSEDTVLLTDDGAEVLTRTGEWPTRTVASCGDGGFEIERHAVRSLRGE